MSEPTFHFSCDWPGGRDAVAEIRCGGLQGKASIPASMGGPGVGTNPDEMLLSAAAACYLMTLAAMIERAGLEVAHLALDSDLVLGKRGGGHVCQRITHRPRLRLHPGTGDAERKQLQHLLSMAERHCMISNALRGNVEIVLEPRVDEA